MSDCPFCDEDNVKNRIFLETENFRVVFDNFPLVDGHSLVISKRHVESPLELTNGELKEMFSTLKKATEILLKIFDLDDFNWVVNKGGVAGQKVNHLHFHILPRRKGDFGGDPVNFFAQITKSGKRKGLKISEERIKELVRVAKTV